MIWRLELVKGKKQLDRNSGIKGYPQKTSEEESLSGADIFVLQMRTSALFDAENLDFSKFMVCPHRQGSHSVRTAL